MKQTAFFMFAVFSAMTCLARIGETPDQCESRYGRPTKRILDNALVFEKSGLLILAEFYNGTCDFISYRKQNTDLLGKPEKLSENEMHVLLKSNGGSLPWKKVDAISMDTQWQTDDRTLIGVWMAIDNVLFVATKENLKRSEDEKKKKEDENLKGF